MIQFNLDFLRLPGVVVRGEIYLPDAPDVMLQDLIEVELPNSNSVDVGWYPEHDADGEFLVATHDSALNELECFSTRNVEAALDKVYSIIQESIQTTATSYDTLIFEPPILAPHA